MVVEKNDCLWPAFNKDAKTRSPISRAMRVSTMSVAVVLVEYLVVKIHPVQTIDNLIVLHQILVAHGIVDSRPRPPYDCKVASRPNL